MKESTLIKLSDKIGVALFNYSNLNLNSPEGKETLLYRFLKANGYTDVAIAVLMAQASVETDGFRTLKEYGGSKYLSKYDFRKGLGNHAKGMGAMYRGRGFIQITGCANYNKVSKFYDLDLVKNPILAEDPLYALFIFEWFIHHGNKFKNGTNVIYWASKGNVKKATRLINGGKNGLSRRISEFKRYTEKYEHKVPLTEVQGNE